MMYYQTDTPPDCPACQARCRHVLDRAGVAASETLRPEDYPAYCCLVQAVYECPGCGARTFREEVAGWSLSEDRP